MDELGQDKGGRYLMKPSRMPEFAPTSRSETCIGWILYKMARFAKWSREFELDGPTAHRIAKCFYIFAIIALCGVIARCMKEGK